MVITKIFYYSLDEERHYSLEEIKNLQNREIVSVLNELRNMYVDYNDNTVANYVEECDQIERGIPFILKINENHNMYIPFKNKKVFY
jgi:hypothetical protein